jgi:hypothetical protein
VARTAEIEDCTGYERGTWGVSIGPSLPEKKGVPVASLDGTYLHDDGTVCIL